MELGGQTGHVKCHAACSLMGRTKPCASLQAEAGYTVTVTTRLGYCGLRTLTALARRKGVPPTPHMYMYISTRVTSKNDQHHPEHLATVNGRLVVAGPPSQAEGASL